MSSFTYLSSCKSKSCISLQAPHVNIKRVNLKSESMPLLFFSPFQFKFDDDCMLLEFTFRRRSTTSVWLDIAAIISPVVVESTSGLLGVPVVLTSFKYPLQSHNAKDFCLQIAWNIIGLSIEITYNTFFQEDIHTVKVTHRTSLKIMHSQILYQFRWLDSMTDTNNLSLSLSWECNAASRKTIKSAGAQLNLVTSLLLKLPAPCIWIPLPLLPPTPLEDSSWWSDIMQSDCFCFLYSISQFS